MTHLERILSHFQGVRKHGRNWKALCPLHGDVLPSLSISLGADGRVLIYDHAGCPLPQILQAVGLTMRDLYPEEVVDTSAVVSPPSMPTVQDLAVRNRIYRDVILSLALDTPHYTQLADRGLSCEGIYTGGYRSIAGDVLIPGCRLEQYGSLVDRVPGVERSGTGNRRFRSRSGLVIPARLSSGRIWALQVRTLDGESKYLWPRGCYPLVHVPLGVDPTASEVWITEGPLKADVAYCLSGLPVVAVASTSQWEIALLALARWKPSKVVIAFDVDWRTNMAVRYQLHRFSDAVARAYPTYIAEWEPGAGKGLDDLLLTGELPVVRSLEEMKWAVKRVETKAAGGSEKRLPF